MVELEPRWQRFGQSLNNFHHDFLNDFFDANLNFLFENLNFLHENLNFRCENLEFAL